jgi:hypothetical protein
MTNMGKMVLALTEPRAQSARNGHIQAAECAAWVDVALGGAW